MLLIVSIFVEGWLIKRLVSEEFVKGEGGEGGKVGEGEVCVKVFSGKDVCREVAYQSFPFLIPLNISLLFASCISTDSAVNLVVHPASQRRLTERSDSSSSSKMKALRGDMPR